MYARTCVRAWLAAVLICMSSTAPWAHKDPISCSVSGVSLVVQAFRADGVTGAAGSVTECESIFYRVTIQPVTEGCAFSGGALTLTTPDGTVTTIADPLPCLGGSGGACTPGNTQLVSDLIPYTSSAADVSGGALTATASYSGGASHNGDVDAPLSATVSLLRPVTACPTQQESSCTSNKLTAASKFVVARSKCYAKAVKQGLAVDPVCLRKATSKLSAKFLSLDAGIGCLTLNDFSFILGSLQTCTDDLLLDLTPTP